tara:strand:- start:3107 stop:3340 length:234 start_codon:yes stop_codon:yes gene_type:complete
MKSTKHIVNPKKLLNSKWTAVTPSNKEKHFMVTKLVLSEDENQPIEIIELEAIMTKRKQTLKWQLLNEKDKWLQGWV